MFLLSKNYKMCTWYEICTTNYTLDKLRYQLSLISVYLYNNSRPIHQVSINLADHHATHNYYYNQTTIVTEY